MLRAEWVDLSERLRRASASIGHTLASIAADTWAARAEILTGSAMLAGWALVTLGVATFAGPVTWAFSGGLLLLSLSGWKLLWQLVAHGLYALTREAPPRGRR